jgi:hypothetical protein
MYTIVVIMIIYSIYDIKHYAPVLWIEGHLSRAI